jgi:hypothetical protein
MLRRRHRLANYLATKDLWATDIAAVSAEDVFFDTFELEESNQVFEYRMHPRAC